MKRNKLKQMYYKDENTFGRWKDLNGNPTKEYTKWLENKLMEQLNLYAVSQRSELLLSYHRFLQEHLSLDLNEIWVKEFLKDSNCC